MTSSVDESSVLSSSVAQVERHGMRPWGLHGIAHWWRVRHNGLLLARHTGADTRVVRLFALFHDSCRADDGWDEEHGPRAAAWLVSLRAGRDVVEHDPVDHRTAEHATASDDASRVDAARANATRLRATQAVVAALDDTAFTQLVAACEHHTALRSHSDGTVNTCFAADRLDLDRVGYRPDPSRIPVDSALLNTAFSDAAVQRTRQRLAWIDVTEFRDAWGIEPKLELLRARDDA